MNLSLVLFLFFGCLTNLSIQVLAQTNCNGSPNLQAIITEDSLQLVKQVSQGKLYATNSPALSPALYVAHLYGTPYQMGYAHGLLLKDQITELFPEFMQYIYNEVGSYLNTLPQWLREIIEVQGVDAALDITFDLTKPFIAQYFLDEAQGLADATGMNLTQVMRVTLFPELIQAGCSMMGAWGKAIQQTVGSLYQLRALDWGTDSPLQKYPTVLVYHPSESNNGHTFATLGWSGFLGAISGYSSSDVGVCEKVWIHYKGQQNRAGIPFTFLLRDILQFDTCIDDALSRIATATRTCSIFIGVGEALTNTFKAIEYSYQEINIFNPTNMPNHTQFDSVVYVDKHTQPSSDPCMPSLIQKYYGQLDALVMFQQIAAQFQTGDMHIAVYDYANRYMYVSNASPSINGTAIPAYNRPFVRLDMNAIFKEPAPTTIVTLPAVLSQSNN